jgi:hypothetical protein
MLEDRCDRWGAEPIILPNDIPKLCRKVDFLTVDVQRPCAVRPEYREVLEDLLFSFPETVKGRGICGIFFSCHYNGPQWTAT